MSTATETPCSCPECGADSVAVNGERLLCHACTDIKLSHYDGSDYD